MNVRWRRIAADVAIIAASWCAIKLAQAAKSPLVDFAGFRVDRPIEPMPRRSLSQRFIAEVARREAADPRYQ